MSCLEKKVQQLLSMHKGVRIMPFEFEGKRYWLKQPEKLSGIWLFLKPQPQKAFQKELAILKNFAKIQAPVPQLVLFGSDYLVLEDTGKTADSWIEDSTTPKALKQEILSDCVDALIALHQRDLIHGRPALRDMTWFANKVHFIDFESRSKSKNLQWLKVRDMIVFLHSYCRVTNISAQEVQWLINECRQKIEPVIWLKMVDFIHKYRPIYRFLRLFKPIARTDLIAIYLLFENFN